MKVLFLMTLFYAGLFKAVSAFASDGIGRVVKLRGTVYVSRGGEQVTVKNGDNIYVGDQLISDARSFAKVLMKDDTIFQIGPKSEFAFEKFKMKTKKDRVATYNLVKGKLRSLFTQKAPKKTLQIKTPTASMGIRGTEILTDVFRVKGKLKTDIALLSGKLEITPKNKKAFFIKPGQMYTNNRFKQKRRIASSAPKVRKLPKHIMRSLRAKEKNGGKVFLFDAMKKERKELSRGANFDFKPKASKLRDPASLKREFKAPEKLKNSVPNRGPASKPGLKKSLPTRGPASKPNLKKSIPMKKPMVPRNFKPISKNAAKRAHFVKVKKHAPKKVVKRSISSDQSIRNRTKVLQVKPPVPVAPRPTPTPKVEFPK